MVRTAEPTGAEMEAPDGVMDQMSAATGLEPDLTDEDDFGMEVDHLAQSFGLKPPPPSHKRARPSTYSTRLL